MAKRAALFGSSDNESTMPIMVGDKFTYTIGSDRYVMTVVAVQTQRRVTLEDRYDRPKQISLRNDGRWREAGRDGGGFYTRGDSGAYMDPSF